MTSRKRQSPSGSLVRSSAAEYLTFVAASGDGGVEAVYADENVWLSQKMMPQLYDVDVRTINYHLTTIYSDGELEENAVIQRLRIAAADGKNYDTKHFGLSATTVVGCMSRASRVGGRVTAASVPGLGAHRVCCNLAWLRDQDVHTPHKPKKARHGS